MQQARTLRRWRLGEGNEKGETHTGCLLATSDNDIGKTGPVPPGCGENGSYFILAPNGGPLTALGLRRSHVKRSM